MICSVKFCASNITLMIIMKFRYLLHAKLMLRAKLRYLLHAKLILRAKSSPCQSNVDVFSDLVDYLYG